MHTKTLPAAGPSVSNLEAHLGEANIPALLMCLYQITGDHRWLEEPYTPTSARGLSRHDDGGLSSAATEQLRIEAAATLVRYFETGEVALPMPDTRELMDMMRICMGQDIPAEYAAMQQFDMHHSAYAWPKSEPDMADIACSASSVQQLEAEVDVPVLIVGAGVSGLALASRLQKLGIRYLIVEKLDGVGGSWLANRYPGCGVDVPSYLYSFSNHRHAWSTHFGKRDEVHGYMESFADSHAIRPNIHFGTEAVDAAFDERTGTWKVRVRSDEGDRTIRSRFFVSAVGLLSKPAIPQLPGMDEFTGDVFHSARWPENYPLEGKNVVVVGTGASSMQIVPAIADQVGRLTVVQRSPQWVAPADAYFESVSSGATWLMENVPFYHAWYRFRLSWAFNDKNYDALQRDPEWPHQDRSINAINEGHRQYFLRYLQEKLGDRPDLLPASTPGYPPFGKRMLLDNGWFDTLHKPNVSLLTGAVQSFTPDGVVLADGTSVPADTVVLCTGFHARQLIQPLNVEGTDSTRLKNLWGDDNAFAYLGMTVPKFPNMFIMYGPNTNPGHGGSYIFLAECQARYIIQAMLHWSDSGALYQDVREDVHDDYNQAVDTQHAGMVWSHQGMTTYYRNAVGRVVATLPWRIVDYWEKTKTFNPRDYIIQPQPVQE